MPIYAYLCAHCGHEKDVLQKLADPVLTRCPACGQEAFGRKLTAPGFQLKGTGWYVTDFRDGNKAPAKQPGKAEPGADQPTGSASDGAAASVSEAPAAGSKGSDAPPATDASRAPAGAGARAPSSPGTAAPKEA